MNNATVYVVLTVVLGVRFPYLQDQRGIEMLEWILIGGIVTGVAIIVYGVLQGNLQNTINTITGKIDTAAQ